MEFCIRNAGCADVSGIMKVMEEARTTTLHGEWFVADDENFVRDHLEENGFIVVAETQEGEIAGFFLVKYPCLEENLGTYLDYTEEELKKVAVMDSAAVAGSYRGNRLQEKMLKAAEKQIDKKRFCYLMCTVHPDNRYSLSNMERNGYIIRKKILCYGGLSRYILEKTIQAE